MFTPCQLCPCLKGLYGHPRSPHFHLLCRGKHRPECMSQFSVLKNKRAYTHQVAHTSPQNILSLFKFTKKKRKKYNRINTFLIHAIVRSQYQQGPLGATTIQSDRKAGTRMNAVTPHPVYSWPNLPEIYGMKRDAFDSLHQVTTFWGSTLDEAKVTNALVPKSEMDYLEFAHPVWNNTAPLFPATHIFSMCCNH